MIPADVEKWIWQHEKVKIFIRADPRINIRIENPDTQMFSSTNTVRQFKNMRLTPILGELEYIILTADLSEAKDDMKLLDLRKGYRENHIM